MFYLDTERNTLFDPRINIVFSLKIKSELPNFKVKLKEKLLYLYSILDITKMKVCLNEDKAYYEATPNSSCEVREAKSHDEVMSLIHEPLDIFNGKLMIAFIEKDKEQYTLTLLAHHLFGDASGIIIFLDYLFKLVNNEKIYPLSFNILNSMDLKEKEPLKKYVSFFLKKKNRLNNNLRPLDKIAYNAIYKVSNKTKFYVDGFKLSNEILEYHIKIAKELGISLNSYFTTILLKTNPRITNVGFAKSIREDESINNQASGLQISYRYKEHESFNKNALKVHQLIKSMKYKYFPIVFMASINAPLVDYVVANEYLEKVNPKTIKLAKLCGYHDSTKKQVGITNLTRINIKQNYSNFIITDFTFIPPITSYTDLTIGIVSNQNGCNIYAHGVNNDNNKELLHNFKTYFLTKKFLI